MHFGEPTLDPGGVAVRIPSGMRSKLDLLTRLESGLACRRSFGNDWDVFEEKLRDLSWLEPSQVAVLHDDIPLEGDPWAVRTYLAILLEAAEYWAHHPGHELVVAFPEGSQRRLRELLVGRWR